MACLFFIISACSSKDEQTNSTTMEQPASSEKNKELIRRLYGDMANKRNYALIDSFFAPIVIDHSAVENQQQGREEFKKGLREFLDMFSALEITPHAIIAEEDMVATRETWKVMMASDKKTLNGETMHIFKIRDGLITDAWSKGWEWLGVDLQPSSAQ